MDFQLTRNDAGSTVEMDLGDSLLLRLPQVGGTAYLWHFAHESASMFEIVDDSIELAESDSLGDEPAVGGASYRLLHLRPLAVGEHLLHLVRHRPWESSALADDDFSLVVRVSI